MNRSKREDFELFDMKDITAAFDDSRWTLLRYSQRHTLKGKGKGITVTPQPAGHMIGGSLWWISKETDEILYAVNYNNIKDRHLSQTVFEKLKNPGLLITDSYNATSVQEKRKKRDQMLIGSPSPFPAPWASTHLRITLYRQSFRHAHERRERSDAH